jgi:hypothetical protein
MPEPREPQFSHAFLTCPRLQLRQALLASHALPWKRVSRRISPADCQLPPEIGDLKRLTSSNQDDRKRPASPERLLLADCVEKLGRRLRAVWLEASGPIDFAFTSGARGVSGHFIQLPA